MYIYICAQLKWVLKSKKIISYCVFDFLKIPRMKGIYQSPNKNKKVETKTEVYAG